MGCFREATRYQVPRCAALVDMPAPCRRGPPGRGGLAVQFRQVKEFCAGENWQESGDEQVLPAQQF
jgi:hypothetical protein